MRIEHAAVLGTGAWGTTFAQVLADAGLTVSMWGRNREVVDFINSHENSTYVPGIELSPAVTATTDVGDAVVITDSDGVMYTLSIDGVSSATAVTSGGIAVKS